MSLPSTGPHELSEEQIERYARQIIVPGIGAAGQARLCSAEVFVDGHPEGARVAMQYLRAAGVRVVTATIPPSRIDCVVLAGATDLPADRVRMLAGAAPVVAWYALTDRGLRGGLTDAARPLTEVLGSATEPHVQAHPVAHRIGGADVATTVVAALLRWIEPGESYELELP